MLAWARVCMCGRRCGCGVGACLGAGVGVCVCGCRCLCGCVVVGVGVVCGRVGACVCVGLGAGLFFSKKIHSFSKVQKVCVFSKNVRTLTCCTHIFLLHSLSAHIRTCASKLASKTIDVEALGGEAETRDETDGGEVDDDSDEQVTRLGGDVEIGQKNGGPEVAICQRCEGPRAARPSASS